MRYLRLLCASFLIVSLPVFGESNETRKILDSESGLSNTPIPIFPNVTPDISNAQPKLEAQTKGGRLYSVGQQKLLVLAGDPYTIGYAHGKLLTVGVRRNVKRVLDFIEKRKKIPQLKQAWERIRPFIPQRYMQEMQGMADASGVPLEKIQIVNIFPALFHCSGFAIFGAATKTGELYHGRVLDYMTKLDFQTDAVTLLVKSGNYNTFVNVGYAGLIGSVTGMNDKQVAIGEIGGGGLGNWDGLAMSLLVRKVLEEGSTLKQAVDIFQKSPRTCEYFYVISDGKINDAKALYTTPEVCDVFVPGQFIDFRGIKFQQPKDGILISGPPRLWFLARFVKYMYGKFTPQLAIALMHRPVAMKSNLHDVLFIPAKLQLYAAHAADPKKVDMFQACYQTYQFYNLKKLLPVVNEISKDSKKAK